jgi:hypothetical protein
VYGTVCGVWQTFCWFPIFLKHLGFIKTTTTIIIIIITTLMCAINQLRLICVFVVLWDWTIARTSINHFDMAIASPSLFLVTSLHHIHYCGVHDTPLVKTLIWLYFVWSRGLVVCATRKHPNYSVYGHKSHDCKISKCQVVDFCKCIYIFLNIINHFAKL